MEITKGTLTITPHPDLQQRDGIWLVCLGSPSPSQELDRLLLPDARPLIIGRKVPDGLQVADQRVSAQHARLTCRFEGGSLLDVKDLGSRNGTFVDGLGVQKRLLAPGQVLRVGDTAWVLLQREAFDPRWSPPEGCELLGRGASARQVLERLARVAETGLSLLLLGETGTGKEVAARELHRLRRPKGPFVVANCAEHDRNLLRSDFFGHKRGAFTGADRDRPGLFVLAHRGTLFLDELGDLPPDAQGALLRAVEQQEVRPVGASRTERVELCIVAATNRDLAAMIEDGTFRSDLYYRLKDWTIRMPPLREHREDIPLLLNHFMSETLTGPFSIAGEVLDALGCYDWPGNIRELRSIALRMAAWPQSRGRVALDEIPAPGQRTRDHHPGAEEAGPNLARMAPARQSGPSIQGVQEGPPLKEVVEDALVRSRGNVSAAARILGTYPKKLYRWMERFDIHPQSYR